MSTLIKPYTFAYRSWSRHTKALVALALVCFFWGTTWLASKQGVRHMPALQMAGIRQLLGGLCFVLFFIWKGAAWPRGRTWRAIIALAIFNFVLSNGLSTWGVKYISAGLASIIAAIVPFWIVLISRFTQKEKPARESIIGLALGFGGICVIFYEHLHDFLDAKFRLGIFLSLVSTLSWAFGTLYTKKHATAFNPYFSLGFQMVLSGLLLLLVALISGANIPLQAIPWQSWSAIVYLALIGSVLTFTAFLYALQHLPTAQSSIYSYVNPVVAVLLGWLILDEKLTPFVIAGVLLTLYGVYRVNKALKQRQ